MSCMPSSLIRPWCRSINFNVTATDWYEEDAPLGKLSRQQIESAYSVLSELQREIVGAQNQSKILDCTNRFYTLVPHDFWHDETTHTELRGGYKDKDANVR